MHIEQLWRTYVLILLFSEIKIPFSCLIPYYLKKDSDTRLIILTAQKKPQPERGRAILSGQKRRESFCAVVLSPSYCYIITVSR